MGQYHVTANITRREFICPHKIGLGLKLFEQVGFRGAMGDVLVALLACSNGRGGGDLPEHPYVGRWAGDQIAVVGDYSEPGDIPGYDGDPADIYRACSEASDGTENGWTDISETICEMLPWLSGVRVVKTKNGWRDRKALQWKTRIAAENAANEKYPLLAATTEAAEPAPPPAKKTPPTFLEI